jgi:hypothetical protein
MKTITTTTTATTATTGQIWTIAETIEGETFPWVGIFQSEEEAKKAIEKHTEEIEQEVEWGEFRRHGEEDTGWITGEVVDDPYCLYIITRNV